MPSTITPVRHIAFMSRDFNCTYATDTRTIACPRKKFTVATQRGPEFRMSLRFKHPPLSFAAGPGIVCYIDSNYTLHCVGRSSLLNSSMSFWPRKATAVDINVSGLICTTNKQGGATCGTNFRNNFISIPYAGKLKKISVGWDHLCGIISKSKHVKCWKFRHVLSGQNVQGRASLVDVGQANPPKNVKFKELSSGMYHTCGLTVFNELRCWGLNISDKIRKKDEKLQFKPVRDFGQDEPPTGKFVSVSSGSHHSCALRTNGEVECWGLDNHGQASPPNRKFADVTAANQVSCGVAEDGDLTCWGKVAP